MTSGDPGGEQHWHFGLCSFKWNIFNALSRALCDELHCWQGWKKSWQDISLLNHCPSILVMRSAIGGESSSAQICVRAPMFVFYKFFIWNYCHKIGNGFGFVSHWPREDLRFWSILLKDTPEIFSYFLFKLFLKRETPRYFPLSKFWN